MKLSSSDGSLDLNRPRSLLLVLATELFSSGHGEGGRHGESRRHSVEGNLVKGQRSQGFNLTSWPLVDLLSHGAMSLCLDQTGMGSKGVLYLL